MGIGFLFQAKVIRIPWIKYHLFTIVTMGADFSSFRCSNKQEIKV